MYRWARSSMKCSFRPPICSLCRRISAGKWRFHTIFYIEGDASGGNLEPRLIGFLRPQDKAFFQLFITVKGIRAQEGGSGAGIANGRNRPGD